MARKKKENGGGGGSAAWMATFADLMNLLLCFFVLLFSLSTVSEEKFEDISISMANSFGIFDGGGAATQEGQLVSAGVSQLNDLDDFFNSMGKSSSGQSDPSNASTSNQGEETNENSEGFMNSSQGSEGIQSSEGTKVTYGEKGLEGTQGTETGQQSSESQKDVEVNQAVKKIQEEKEKVSMKMYDLVSDLTDLNHMMDDVELSIDPGYNSVQMTLKGSVLYDSGSAELKEKAKPVMDKVGNVLSNFKNYKIEIVGHTDNVPISDSTYRDNNWLSSARALNAAQYLIDHSGIDPKLLKYSGRGEYEPIASNSTAQGRAKNRRIEIKIYNQYSEN